MGLISQIANGDTFDKKILRREKQSNGRWKNRWDKAAEIEDPDTGETQLKFKSDGAIVPKPEGSQFETLWYTSFLDKLTRDVSHCDFIEVYLKDTGSSGDGDWVEFNPEGGEDDEADLGLVGSESQFQTHRDLESEKTLDIFSEEDNQEWYFLAGLGVITMINLGGMYIIVNGLDQAIKAGVKEGFKTVAGSKSAITGNWVLFAFMGSQALKTVKSKLSSLKPW
jgi:hypothetical protein